MAYGQEWQQVPLATFQIEQFWVGIGMAQLRRVVPLEQVWQPPLLQYGLLGLLYYQGGFLPLRALEQKQIPLQAFYGQIARHPDPKQAPAVARAPSGRIQASVETQQRWAVIVTSQTQDMALSVDGAGKLFPRYRLGDKNKPAPMLLRDWDVQHVLIDEGEIWLLDTDSLALPTMTGEM